MNDKTHPPSIRRTAFECPHCDAYTTQYWYNLYAQQIDRKNKPPFIPNQIDIKNIKDDKDMPEKQKQSFLDLIQKIDSGLVFLQHQDGKYIYNDVQNLHISECYICQKFAIWVHNNLIYPERKQAEPPNDDLPQAITRDFEEARSIVQLSPRGAVALLRLCIQKLCAELGAKGNSIDENIASLVSKGLDPLIQQALDIVRVIGNEAVHPGVIDLKDDLDTAYELFGLVNAIADQMITHPKKIKALYEKLPEEKRKAIEKRDKGEKK